MRYPLWKSRIKLAKSIPISIVMLMGMALIIGSITFSSSQSRGEDVFFKEHFEYEGYNPFSLPSHSYPIPTDDTILPWKEVQYEKYQTVAFPNRSFVIPMDDKQTDIMKSFGFVHALLRDNVTIYRIIEPPDIKLYTTINPSGAIYAGGPILVMPQLVLNVTKIKVNFPTVHIDTTTELIIADNVFVSNMPTKILIVSGSWGESWQLLDDMKIPYTLKTTSAINGDPTLLLEYNLVVDDCPGWWGYLPQAVINTMRTLVADGGEIIFTDIALKDLSIAFPNFIEVVRNSGGTFPCEFHPTAEFLAQYNGSTTIPLYTMRNGCVISKTNHPNVNVMIDSRDYNSNYRILAAYFRYGRGIVEAFAYHPQEQPGDSYVLSSIFFGNKFVHALPVALPPPPLSPLPMTLPISPPPPSVPPPPPGIPMATPIPVYYALAAFVGLSVLERVKSKIRIGLKQKIAMRA